MFSAAQEAERSIFSVYFESTFQISWDKYIRNHCLQEISDAAQSLSMSHHVQQIQHDIGIISRIIPPIPQLLSILCW